MKRIFALVVLFILIAVPALVLAQASGVDPASADSTDILKLLTSITGVTTLTVMATGAAKKALADTPRFNAVPVFAYVIAFAIFFTWIGNKLLGTLPGQMPVLTLQAIWNAAAASGVREWVYNGTKPLSKSGTAIALLLVCVIGAQGCGKTVIPQLPASLPAAVTSADEQLRAATQWTLGVMAASEGLLDESIGTFEQVKSVASPSMIAGTQTVFTSLNQGLKTAYASIAKGVTSWESLRATVEPIVSQAQQLRDLVATLPAPAQTRQGFAGLVKSLLAALSSILPELLKRSSGTLAAVGA